MDRRQFITVGAAGLASLGLRDKFSLIDAMSPSKSNYSVVILGDTHFDTEPESVYHSFYDEKVEWLNKVQRQEFARNGEMWRERCPKLLKRAACLVSPDTRLTLQMGDLIQGDCGNPEVHKKMLGDVMDRFKEELGGLPFVTVVGNHDVRGVGAWQAYGEFMPQRMSQELGKEITKTTFSFNVQDDAYIVVDFNDPDTEEIEKLLKDAKGARNCFVISHGPLFPYDGSSCRWFLLGSKKDDERRRYFRNLFARQNVIALCGHTHNVEFLDWQCKEGRITQMTMNSVWSKESLAKYNVKAQGAEQYGELRKKVEAMPNGSPVEDETPLFDEYRDGLRSYSSASAAGSFKMNVSGKNVSIDFYGGDSTRVTQSFVLR